MNNDLCTDIIHKIRSLFRTKEYIPLHAPIFSGNEKKYLNDCIDSGYVSSVGEYVNKFERMFGSYVKSRFAVAAVNGTAALQVALRLVGVGQDDEVLTQPLSFIGTANAISYCGAKPVFIDVEKTTLGMDPQKLQEFLKKNTYMGDDGRCYNKKNNRPITACVPVHIFGHPCRIDMIQAVCNDYNIALIEDAAESIGSIYKQKHTGTFGIVGIFSFNGNKTITTGGGGMIVTDDENLAKRAKHITTTAKLPHAWEYIHDEIGFNYRMPNINAALGCAQLELLDKYLANKRKLALSYKDYFADTPVEFVGEPPACRSNYWLNAVIFKDRQERDAFLKMTNENGVMTRPCWRLLNKLAMYSRCETFCLEAAPWLEDRIVNIPSSVRAAEWEAG
ncbi:MAG: LegC family aminotransferase [Spirochaetales bacterium]|nr:LegC family aminotransferase [Spirochaetales bacterium]